VNIALINELSLIFNRLGIDTQDVLEAAGTKWNFLPFRPGLVGGHCIGVDPYYLTHKAQSVGYHPEVVLAGRRINDGMGAYVVNRTVREMIARDIAIKGARVLVMGLTFKENCPDLRNTRVVDILSELDGYGMNVDVHDPWVDADAAKHEYGLAMTTTPETGAYDAVIVAVAHQEFIADTATPVTGYTKPNAVIFDVKAVLPRAQGILRL
jgi:UDP-N-acetyl-D-galactosamine dehydrogenase